MKHHNKTATIFIPVIVSILVIVSFLGGRFSANTEVTRVVSNASRSNMLSASKFGYILNLIDKKYVDAVNVDTLSEEYIEKMLHKLDPHSAYIPAVDAVENQEQLEGHFDGIGIMFNMATDTIIVQSVIAGGPADSMGMLPGDRIIIIDDSLVAGRKINQNEVVKMLKGPGGSTVTIKVERSGNDSLFSLDIVRGKIAIKSIDAAYMVAPKVGYIKLLQFSRTTHTEFIKAVEELKSQGMEKLIFDLTANSGGYLDQAILIANEFLPEGKLIVYTEGRKSRLAEQYSDGTGRFQSQDLVVMIDETSASSSEIVAGALQDNDRGTIIGRRSFGKGLVQQSIPLSDGSIVNITIARYHTPTGRSIQRPYDKGYDQYYSDFIERYKRMELLYKDSIKLVDSLKYTTPNGKIVYGGGGIMPDVFVPLDTTIYTSGVVKVFNDNTLLKYALEFTDKNRGELIEITTLEELKSYFEKNGDAIYNGFVKFARSRKKSVNPSAKEKATIKNYLFAYISRNSGADDNGFYLYFNNLDNIFQEALKIHLDSESIN
ncbi:MAG: S41 family peptidase [Rikenellaceae bacterium]